MATKVNPNAFRLYVKATNGLPKTVARVNLYGGHYNYANTYITAIKQLEYVEQSSKNFGFEQSADNSRSDAKTNANLNAATVNAQIVQGNETADTTPQAIKLQEPNNKPKLIVERIGNTSGCLCYATIEPLDFTRKLTINQTCINVKTFPIASDNAAKVHSGTKTSASASADAQANSDAKANANAKATTPRNGTETIHKEEHKREASSISPVSISESLVGSSSSASQYISKYLGSSDVTHWFNNINKRNKHLGVTNVNMLVGKAQWNEFLASQNSRALKLTPVSVGEIAQVHINAKLIHDYLQGILSQGGMRLTAGTFKSTVQRLHGLISRRALLIKSEDLTNNIKVVGLKVSSAGRFGGNAIAKSVSVAFGRLPLQTYSASIDYYQSSTQTKYGTQSLKVWVYMK